MTYTGTYIDENGSTKSMTVNDTESEMALKNDYEALLRTYNPRIVSITEVEAGAGETLRLKITVNAPSHYLVGSHDTNPKECRNMTVYVACYPGYPITQIRASYDKDFRLASPNVFVSGGACIDQWKIATSSLLTVVDKLVHDIIHDPEVSRYESPACSALIKWHEDNCKARRFPTIPPKLLYSPDAVPLPPRRVSRASAPPPLPVRRGGN